MLILTHWETNCVWQLSVVHLATNYNTHCLLILLFKYVGINVVRYHHSVRTWKTRQKSDFGKKFSNLSIFQLKLSYASIFKTNISQRVRFWFKGFTMRQILDWKKYNTLDFELKIFRHVRFWKNVCIQKITFWFFLLRENEIFCIFRAFFKKHDF